MCHLAKFFLTARTHKKITTKMSRKGTKMSCDGLTLGKSNFWIHYKSSFTPPATCFDCYDGTDTEMGRRRFQRWVGCNLGTLKKSSNFSSVYRFPPNSKVWVPIRTVLFSQAQKYWPETHVGPRSTAAIATVATIAEFATAAPTAAAVAAAAAMSAVSAAIAAVWWLIVVCSCCCLCFHRHCLPPPLPLLAANVIGDGGDCDNGCGGNGGSGDGGA